MNICYTVATQNYIKDSLRTRASFLKYNSSWRFVIVIADLFYDSDALFEFKRLRSEGVEFLFLCDVINYIDDSSLESILVRYNAFEFSCAAKAVALRFFLASGFEKVIYIDSDVLFYNSCERAEKLLDRYDALVTPHHVAENYPSDGKCQQDAVINLAGMMNAGFLAIRNSDNGRRIADYWFCKLKDSCYSKPSEGLMCDQIWLQWLPCIFDNVFILRDKGYNASYWNIHERNIYRENGIWMSGSDPLVFFHFSGLDLNNLDGISKYQNRYRLSELSDDIRLLFNEYAEECRDYYSKISFLNRCFFSFLPNTDFSISDSVRPFLLKNYESSSISCYSGDIGREVSILRAVGDCNVYERRFLGVSIAGRLYSASSDRDFVGRFIRAFLSAGVPFSFINTGNDYECGIHSGFRRFIRAFESESNKYPALVLIIDPGNIDASVKKLYSDRCGKYVAAVFSEESEESLKSFSEYFDMLDEIMLFSDSAVKFMQDRFPMTNIRKLPSLPEFDRAYYEGNNVKAAEEFFDNMHDFAVLAFKNGNLEEKNLFFSQHKTIEELENRIKSLSESARRMEDSCQRLKDECKRLNDINKSLQDSCDNINAYGRKLDEAYKRLEFSVSYRLGRLLTAPASFILGLFKKK